MIWADSGLVKMFCAKSALMRWALVRVMDCSRTWRVRRKTVIYVRNRYVKEKWEKGITCNYLILLEPAMGFEPAEAGAGSGEEE